MMDLNPPPIITSRWSLPDHARSSENMAISIGYHRKPCGYVYTYDICDIYDIIYIYVYIYVDRYYNDN